MTNYDLQNAIYENLHGLRPGSLCFWGNWFGKPYDNYHRIVGAVAFDNRLVVSFDLAETLTIDAPQDWTLDGGKLLVRRADRILFQWFEYGRLPSRDTLRFQEYESTDAGLRFVTDFQPEIGRELDCNLPAVQLYART